jgi:hypothetical protein
MIEREIFAVEGDVDVLALMRHCDSDRGLLADRLAAGRLFRRRIARREGLRADPVFVRLDPEGVECLEERLLRARERHTVLRSPGSCE